jgi:hypothetical protein
VQGVTGATGSANLTAKTERFTDGTSSVQVVQPVLVIYSGLPASTTSLSGDSPFYVGTGILNNSGGFYLEGVSSAGPPVTVTLTSSNVTVGQLKTTTATGASVTVTIPINTYWSPSTVASGGVAFHPLTGGTTTVSATAPGFNAAYSGSSQLVTVTQSGMTFSGSFNSKPVGGNHGDGDIPGRPTDSWLSRFGAGATPAQMKKEFPVLNHGAPPERIK